VNNILDIAENDGDFQHLPRSRNPLSTIYATQNTISWLLPLRRRRALLKCHLYSFLISH